MTKLGKANRGCEPRPLFYAAGRTGQPGIMRSGKPLPIVPEFSGLANAVAGLSRRARLGRANMHFRGTAA